MKFLNPQLAKWCISQSWPVQVPTAQDVVIAYQVSTGSKIPREERMDEVSEIVGRKISSFKELSPDELRGLMEAIKICRRAQQYVAKFGSGTMVSAS